MWHIQPSTDHFPSMYVGDIENKITRIELLSRLVIEYSHKLIPGIECASFAEIKILGCKILYHSGLVAFFFFGDGQSFMKSSFFQDFIA
jgi:hypothetical protein